MSRALRIQERQNNNNNNNTININNNDNNDNNSNNRRKWYDEEKYDGVMFVNVTLNGELKKRAQHVCRKNKVKVKVVEKINSTVKRSLQRSNPYGHEHCGRNDCVTCNLGLPINCRERGNVYKIGCIDS